MSDRKILDAMENAEAQAWKSLARYKFFLFGYHAARWVNYNALLAKPERRPNPFRSAVRLARQRLHDAPDPNGAAGATPEPHGMEGGR